MNMSLSTGIFPDIWKQAIINPLIKKPSLDSNELKNYRPVANISFTSKLIEKHVFNCINEHMDINNVGEELQSAYRSIHSTETALLQVKTDIMTYLHQQEGVFVVLLDLSAAFDTVEHTILLNRMASEIGLTGTALKWMESYFTGRTTKVGVNGTYSKPQSMQYGLPQGSIVGPGSFKIYIIPIGRIIRKHGLKYHLYADDIQLYISFNPSDPNSILTALAKLSACINEIRMWMTGNMLMLNDSKTEFFVAVSQNNSSKMPPVHLQIGTEIIKPSATVRNLGVLFDTHMTMSPHISGLSKTTSSNFAIYPESAVFLTRTHAITSQDHLYSIVWTTVTRSFLAQPKLISRNYSAYRTGQQNSYTVPLNAIMPHHILRNYIGYRSKNAFSSKYWFLFINV